MLKKEGVDIENNRMNRMVLNNVNNEGVAVRKVQQNKKDDDEDEDILLANTIADGGWHVIKKLGGGGFGQVYHVELDNKICAMKVEGIKDTSRDKPSLKREYDILHRIARKEREYKAGDVDFPIKVTFKYFCEMEDCSKELKSSSFLEWKIGGAKPTNINSHCMSYYHITMTLLGRNLSDLRRREADQHFTNFTIAHVALETFRAIKCLHAIGFVHRDIKASNFAIGNRNQQEIFLVDFGLAYTFGKLATVDVNGRSISIYPPHAEYVAPERRATAGFRGTVRYASLRAHREEYLTYQDDLISWFYMLIEISCGALPWRKVKEKKDVQNVKERYQNVEKFFQFYLHDEKGRVDEMTSHSLDRDLQEYFRAIYKRISNIEIEECVDVANMANENEQTDVNLPPTPGSKTSYAEIEKLLIQLRMKIDRSNRTQLRRLDWETDRKLDRTLTVRSAGGMAEVQGAGSRLHPIIPSNENLNMSKEDQLKLANMKKSPNYLGSNNANNRVMNGIKARADLIKTVTEEDDFNFYQK